MGNLAKRKDVRTETARVVVQNVQAVYVKVTAAKCTTSEATELGVLRMFQLGLLVVQQIGAFNLNVLKIF